MKGRFQFSIETLLIATLVVCVFLGWLRLRSGWKHENIMWVTASKTVDGRTVLYSKSLTVYADNSDHEFPPPIIGSVAAFRGLGVIAFFALITLGACRGRKFPNVRKCATVVLGTVLLIGAYEIFDFVIRESMIYPAR